MDNENPPEQNEDRPRIKVTDRRKFTADGNLRPGGDETPAPRTADEAERASTPVDIAADSRSAAPGAGSLAESEAQPAGAKPTEARPALAKPTEARPALAKPTEARPALAKPTEAQPAGGTPTETRPAESSSTEATPAETRPTETKPRESHAAAGAVPDAGDSGDIDDSPIVGPQPGISELPRDFAALVEGMYFEAMLYLGAIPDPRTGEVMDDADLAKYKIDLLSILQTKTEGNLTAEEKRQLEEALYQLRMAYLQITKTARL